MTIFLVLTISLGFALNIWQDESYTLHTTTHGFLRGFRDGVTFEVQAPLYFGVLSTWRMLNDSVFFARSLSIVFSLVTLVYAWKFARRYLPRMAPDFVVAVVALNPFTIWAAVEMRPYAAAIALSFALLYYFFRGWIEPQVNWRARAAFVAVAILGAYTQYYIVTLVPAGLLALLTHGPRRGLISYVLCAFGIGVVLTPIIFFLPLQLAAYSAVSAAAPIPVYASVLPLFEFLFPHESIGSWSHHPVENACYLVASLVPAVLVARSMKRVALVSRVLLTVTIGLTLIFAAFIGIFHLDVIFPRQIAVLFAPILFVGFAFAGDVPRRRRLVVVKIFGAIYCVLVVLGLWTDYRGLSKNGDWKNVGAFLYTHVTAEDAVAVFDPEAQLPLSQYFDALPVTPIPRAQTFERFDQEAFVLRSESDLAQSLGRAAIGRRHVWLVVNDACVSMPAFYGCDRLDSYVSQHFSTISVTNFNGSSVTELISKRAPMRTSRSDSRGYS